jgi:hypothetical protein
LNGASYTFLVAVAETGARCGQLTDWEAATIRAETRRLLSRFPPDEQANLLFAASAQAAAATCDDEEIALWIGAARPGIEREWLPPNLALFRAFATMIAPPLTFIAAINISDLAGAVAVIDAQFQAFERDGVLPEGGRSWNAYTACRGRPIMRSLSGGGGVFTADEAAAFIVEAAVITTLWLAAQSD